MSRDREETNLASNVAPYDSAGTALSEAAVAIATGQGHAARIWKMRLDVDELRSRHSIARCSSGASHWARIRSESMRKHTWYRRTANTAQHCQSIAGIARALPEAALALTVREGHAARGNGLGVEELVFGVVAAADRPVAAPDL